MQTVKIIEAVHTGVLPKINRLLHKTNIRLFSNVLFFAYVKKVQKIAYC